MYIYFLIFFLSLPFVFLLSKNWKKDRYIGELSYPIYISHWLVLMSINYLKIPIFVDFGFMTIILTIPLSFLLNKFISFFFNIVGSFQKNINYNKGSNLGI